MKSKKEKKTFLSYPGTKKKKSAENQQPAQNVGEVFGRD
jgi:hypothetical protein